MHCPGPSAFGEYTTAVHAGTFSEGVAVRTPLVLGNSYEFPYDPRELDWTVNDQLMYTRTSGVNQLALQTKLAAIEGAEAAVALASGVAAVHAVLFTFLRAGDHVVCSREVYEATHNLLVDLLPSKYGITATLVDVTDLAAVEAAFTPATRLVVTESIANPTTTLADIPALAALAHAHDALLVVDSTFTPPPVLRPLDLGADLVVHSATKYLNGHGDAIAGAVLGRTSLIDPIKQQAMIDVGGVIAPFNAWLVERGAATLPLRIRRVGESAQRVAEFLDEDPRVAWVRYPGLDSHPQRELAARLLTSEAGAGGMLAWAPVGDADAINAVIDRLRLITATTSLGHDETLVVHVAAHGPRQDLYGAPFTDHGTIRMSVGLEDVDDLLADLDEALAPLGPRRIERRAPQPDRTDPATLGESSQAVHAANRPDPATRSVRTPIVFANSYRLPEDPSSVSWSTVDVPIYTRNASWNQGALQRRVAALDGAEDAAVLASGVAALHAAFFTVLRAGDHVVCSDQTYEAVQRLLGELLPVRSGIETTFVDTSDLAAVRAAIRPTTRLVHTETIANPTTRVADVPTLAAIAHEAGALLTVDATFTPPPLARPLADGADLVIHSLTKYVNGHGDALAGSVSGSAELIARVKGDAVVDVGGIISPFVAWLVARGSATLPLRLRRQTASTLAIARRLEADPRVAFVAYPGLASHPQHALAAERYPLGHGGVLSFVLDGDAPLHTRFVSALRLITPAVSLGHDETLIVHIGEGARRGSSMPAAFARAGHLRLAVGLEDLDDLVADLEQALDAAFR